MAALAERPAGDPRVVRTAGGLSGCRWDATPTVSVQAVSASSLDWGAGFPQVLDQLESTGVSIAAPSRRRLEAARRLVESGGRLDADRACAIFSILVEVQGQPAGKDHLVSVLPTGQEPQAISGQACSEDQFSAVALVAPGLSGSASEMARVTRALGLVHPVPLAG